MNKNQLMMLGGAAVMIPTAALANDYELIRSYTLAEGAAEYEALNTNASNIKVGVQIQGRYQINSRDDASTALAMADDDFTQGFVIRRAKVAISGDVTESITGKLQFAFDRGSGAAKLEDAALSWEVNDDFTIRVGQFKPGVLREELVSSKKQLSAERSATNETFNQDYTQGVELKFGGDQWRGTVSLNDGFKAGNTAFNSASEADFGVSARAEFLVGGGEFGQFKQFTSFRGSNSGGMVGVALHHETMGDTNPSFTPTTDMTTGTVDFSWAGDGWNVFAAGIWRSMDMGVMTVNDYGLVLQGGAFVSDQDEIFARWSSVMPDEDNGVGSDEDYNDVTVGWNHYLMPESHAAKFTLAVTFSLDAPGASIVKTSDGHNLLSDSEDGQIGLIGQMQILY